MNRKYVDIVVPLPSLIIYFSFVKEITWLYFLGMYSLISILCSISLNVISLQYVPNTPHDPMKYIHDVHVADSKLCIAVCNLVVVFLKDFLNFHK